VIDYENLSEVSIGSGCVLNPEKRKIDTKVEDEEARHNKTPTTSYSQPTYLGDAPL
jgi:hypothetical protein